ncbi:MAG TPA: hypothetical protein DGA22_04050 [Acidobacterium sp.]|nr:hypothetical protein [Acidobacterium sp.]
MAFQEKRAKFMLGHRTPWLLSRRASALLNGLSWMTAIVSIVGIAASFLLPPGQINLGDSLWARFLFWVICCLLAPTIVGEFTLWFCMLWFCIRHYKANIFIKAICLAIQVFLFSWASAILYFVAYRPEFMRRINSGVTAPQRPHC